MKSLLIIFPLLFITVFSNAQQTTAMDFTMDDCNGQIHNLYSELDSGNVVILEFFMLSCGSCIDAGDVLEVMHNDLNAQYGGNKVRFYHFGYSNGYNCTDIKNWVSTNGYSSTPFDSGAYQVAYYGGMGMPTIAVVAGSAHEVLFTNVGFSTSDTTIIASEIRSFLGSNSKIKKVNSSSFSLATFPNPITENLTISFQTKESGILILELTNVMGQKIRDLTTEKIKAGSWKHSFSIDDLANGNYFIRGRFNDEVFSEKITIQQ